MPDSVFNAECLITLIRYRAWCTGSGRFSVHPIRVSPVPATAGDFGKEPEGVAVAVDTAKAIAANVPVKVFGKARAVRERGRGGMSAVQGGKRTVL